MKFARLSRLLDQTDDFLSKLYPILIGLGVVVAAFLARRAFLAYESVDYTFYLMHWTGFIQTHGGFWALKYNFADYNPPYLYLLVFTTSLPIKGILAVKSISLAFDVLLAIGVYLLVFEKYQKKMIAFIAASGVLFLPTVLLNSAMWAQVDASYTSFCLLSLYFLLRKKGALSCVAAGVALSFKLQTVFFLPVLIIGVIKKEIHALYLLLIPVVFGLLLVPAAIAGRPLSSLLGVYFAQSSEVRQLTLNAANIYQWIPGDQFFRYFNSGGIYFTLGLVLILILLVSHFSGKLQRDMFVRLSLLLALMIPFFLPQMHERYFYVAEVVSVVYAVYFPRYLYMPLLVQTPTVITYLFYFTRRAALPMQVLPLFLLAAMGIVMYDLVRELRRQPAQTAVARQAVAREDKLAVDDEPTQPMRATQASDSAVHV